jgi:N-acyl-D-amino-acid deacylase
VIFNPDSVQDQATYADPKQYSTGIETVMVNGQVVIDKGRRQKVYQGRVLGRTE